MGKKEQRSLTQAVRHIIETPWKALLVLSGVTLAGYSNILANGLVLNDNSLLFGWNLILSLNNVYMFFARFVPPDSLADVYAPLRVLLLALNLKLWGISVTGYHLFSLAVHLCAVVIVFLLVHRLTADRTAAFLTGLLFSLHPANSASIAYFTASTAAAGMTMAMAAFFFYVRALGFSRSLTGWEDMEELADDDADDEVRPFFLWLRSLGIRPADYFVSILFALASVLTSQQAVVLPVLFLWFDGVFHRTEESLRVRVARALPFFVIAAFYFLMKKIALGQVFGSGYIAGSFYLSLVIAFKSCLQYLRFSVWPWPLSFKTVLSEGIFSSGVRDFKEPLLLTQSLLEPRVVLAFALVAGIFAFSAVKRKKSPIFLFCAGWFFISLLPVIDLFPQTVLFSLESLYFPLFAFCLVFAFLIGKGAQWLKDARGRYSTLAASMVVLSVLVLYAVGTFLNNRSYQSSGTLSLRAVQVNPQIPSLRHDLAVLLAQAGRDQEALKQFQKAVELKPEEPQYHFALAGMYAQLGQDEDAITQLKRAAEIEPQFAEAYFNLAVIYANRKDMKTVQKYLTLAKEAFVEQKRFVEAAELFNSASRFFLSADPAANKTTEKDQ